MKNLSKLFGHKPGAESGEEAQAEQPAANDPAAEAAAGQTAPLQKPEFGLAFFVEDGAPKTFTRLPINIGRNEQNDLVLQDETVSAQHAQVYYDERLQQICIVDLDSLNGIFINELATRRNLLMDDARIRLGNAVLTFRDTGYIHPGT